MTYKEFNATWVKYLDNQKGIINYQTARQFEDGTKHIISKLANKKVSARQRTQLISEAMNLALATITHIKEVKETPELWTTIAMINGLNSTAEYQLALVNGATLGPGRRA